MDIELSGYTDLVSAEAFGREIGRSRTTVRRYIEKGVLPSADGKVPRRAGLEAWEKILASQRKPAASEPVPVTGAAEGMIIDSDDPDDDRDILELEAMVSIDPVSAYNQAKALETIYKARERKLIVRQKSGELIETAEAQRQFGEIVTQIRGVLISIPQRAAGRCEKRSMREIEDILEDEINSALEEIRSKKIKA